VRRTNQKIICQVVWSTIAGDKVKVSADSFELKRFGLTAGLTNYAAAYCTGLLTARRLLTLLDEENKKRNINSTMAKTFNLVPETTGEYVNISELAQKKNVEQKPFTCFLDLGLARATVGNRVFAALKGAVDGGIHIPHSDKIFPKAGKKGDKKEGKGGKEAKETKDSKGGSANPLRDRIFGVHVQNYMEKLKKDKTLFTKQFSVWERTLTDSKVKTLEELYKKVHAAIRGNPTRVVKPKKNVVKHKTGTEKNTYVAPNGKKYRKDVKISIRERKNGVAERISKYIKERENIKKQN